MFVAEGRVVVQRLLDDRKYRVHSVVVTPAAAGALHATFSERPDVDVLVCEPDILEAVTGFDFHRGCLALAYRNDTPIALEELATAQRLLALEGIANPDNVGGLFRTALALGAGGILLDPTTADPLYRKAVRTSMGATLRVPYRRGDAWPGELHELRSRGFRVIALTPAADAMPLGAFRLDGGTPAVVLVGSEGTGLSTNAMSAADVRVRIPVDPRADSLNVVVAAGIVLNTLKPNASQ